MSETKFTRGPWYGPHLADDDCTCNCRSIIDGSYAGGIASVHLNNGIASISDGGNDAPPLEEAKANGSLIAAAPELYAALEWTRDNLVHDAECAINDKLPCTCAMDGVFAVADAALSKARGETP